jgi:CheY-like chemotaxis protein
MKSDKKNLLIIEDHDSIRHLLGVMLNKNFSVTTKKDGIEGLVWLGDGNLPDLILLDMHMPEMDGISFLQQVKSSGFFKQIQVIIISANDNEHDLKYAYELGVRRIFKKPFNPLNLQQEIDSVLENFN